MIQSRLFLLRDNNFIHGALSDLKTLQDVFIHLDRCYTLHESSFKKKHNWGTLNCHILSNYLLTLPFIAIKVHEKFME